MVGHDAELALRRMFAAIKSDFADAL